MAHRASLNCNLRSEHFLSSRPTTSERCKRPILLKRLSPADLQVKRGPADFE
ncbi:hypothetical protein FQN60_005006 [Etheostoma spectabile]|uniref:Uncharacterized protein n=1 Tax=Etheostoma spectabile TaxID=54343 RepID=A0A5J5DLK8_9PERO|nr:hypothetical protein FQN60_005006 [Etheostoma spectabile]